jgi:hypothetical protein
VIIEAGKPLPQGVDESNPYNYTNKFVPTIRETSFATPFLGSLGDMR